MKYLFFILIPFIIFSSCVNNKNKNINNKTKFLVIFDGKIDNNPWILTGISAIEQIKNKYHYNINYTNIENKEDIKNVIDKESKLIIGYGAQFLEYFQPIVNNYKDKFFIIIGNYQGNNKNLGAVKIRNNEIAYILGMVASLSTKTKKIGLIGGYPYSHLKEFEKSFINGAKSICNNIEIRVEYLYSWSDTNKSLHVASNMSLYGIDVILPNADIANISVYEFCNQNNIKLIKYLDTNHLKYTNTIVSAYVRYDRVLNNIVNLYEIGKLKAIQYKYGFKDDVFEIKFNDQLINKADKNIISNTIIKVINDEIFIE